MIRYDKQLNAELRRTVANFNAKVKRLEKEERQLIPSLTSVEELKSKYNKRYELKRKMKELQRFSERGVEEVISNESGTEFTKWSLDNLKREIRRANYNINREAKKLEAKSSPLTITRNSALNRMRSQQDVINKDLINASLKDVEKIWSNINRVMDYDQSAERFQENYLQMLFSEYGKSNVSGEVVDTLTSYITKLSPDQLVRLNKVSPEIQKITEISPSPPFTVHVSEKQTGHALNSLYEKIIDGSLDSLL